MPTYNRAELLPAAIRSVLQQTYTSWELIIVDDGSTDKTKNILSSFLSENHSKIIYINKNNGGCASARNAGINIAQGKYIALLDSDDLYMPAKLEFQTKLLEDNPSAGFVYSDAFEFNPLTRKIWLSRVANHMGYGDFAINHFMTNHARSGALLYRKYVLDQVGGFREDFCYNEDSHFLQEIALRSEGCYSEYPSYLVRNHTGSKSRQLIGLIEHEQRSVELICNDFPEFVGANRKNVTNRKNELKAKLSIAHLISGNLLDAYSIYPQVGITGLIGGISRIVRRRVKKIINRNKDRQVVYKHTEDINKTIGDNFCS